MMEIAERVRNEASALEHKRNKIIWFCWLQGIENAPEVVKACYRSLQRHLGIAGQARNEGYDIMHEQRGADGAAAASARHPDVCAERGCGGRVLSET